MKNAITFFLLAFTSLSQAQTLTKINDGGGLHNPIIFQGKLFFLSNDGTNGEGLYYTDGITNSIHFVKTVIGTTSTFTESGGKLFFAADDGSHGTELWVSDGTSGGTGMVKDIAPGLASSIALGQNYFWSIAFQNKYYFGANDGTNGNEVWVSDGTLNGTFMLKNIAGSDTSGLDPYSDPLFTIFQNKLYFFANSNTDLGTTDELWVTDGTNANTTIAAHFYYEYHKATLVLNDKLWLQAVTMQYTDEVFLYDTASIYYLNSDFPLASLAWSKSSLTQPIIYQGKVLLGNSNDSNNDSIHYFMTDGTINGTNEILTDVSNKFITEAIVNNGKLFFMNWNNSTLYASDFTTATNRLAPIATNYSIGLVAVGNKACFQRSDSYGMEPWVTDGTSGGTSRLKDLTNSSADGLPSGSSWDFIAYNGQLYFADEFSFSNLWKTDGTGLGTQRVALPTDTFVAVLDSYNGGAIVFNGCLYMQVTSTGWFSDYEIWKYCDGSAGVSAVAENDLIIYPNPASSQLFIRGNDNDMVEINIYNAMGDLVRQAKQFQNKYIDVSCFTDGIYIAELITKEGHLKYKWIKM